MFGVHIEYLHMPSVWKKTESQVTFERLDCLQSSGGPEQTVQNIRSRVIVLGGSLSMSVLKMAITEHANQIRHIIRLSILINHFCGFDFACCPSAMH